MTTTLTMAAMRELAFARLEAELPAAVMLRHRIHADPQLGGDEIVTSDAIAGSLPTPVHRLAEGLWTRVGADWGPAIGFRAELDALPINEVNGFYWRSVRRGVAHVCGHDVHTAALTAVTNALHGLDLQVAMVAAFQPREETIPSGAKDFINDIAFLANDLRAMVAVHLQPVIPAGSFSAVGGTINASADNFQIVIHGRPAHGAYPHLSRDPVVAASALVQAIQHLVSRRINPMNPAVVTIGKITGGESENQVRVRCRWSARSAPTPKMTATGCSGCWPRWRPEWQTPTVAPLL